jgi:hypothetical protein
LIFLFKVSTATVKLLFSYIVKCTNHVLVKLFDTSQKGGCSQSTIKQVLRPRPISDTNTHNRNWWPCTFPCRAGNRSLWAGCFHAGSNHIMSTDVSIFMHVLSHHCSPEWYIVILQDLPFIWETQGTWPPNPQTQLRLAVWISIIVEIQVLIYNEKRNNFTNKVMKLQDKRAFINWTQTRFSWLDMSSNMTINNN